MHIYIYTHTYIYIFTYIYIYMNIRVYTHRYVYISVFLQRVFACVCVLMYIHMCTILVPMGWLRLVGSLKLQVSFAEYRLFHRALLQKRPIILWSLLHVATPYLFLTISHHGLPPPQKKKYLVGASPEFSRDFISNLKRLPPLQVIPEQSFVGLFCRKKPFLSGFLAKKSHV